MNAGAAIALFVLQAAPSAIVPSLPVLQAGQLVDLEYEFDHAAWEETCFGYDNDEARAIFERRYGGRMRTIRRWFEARFSQEDFSSYRQKRYGDSIMVGGCPSNGQRREEKTFTRSLGIIERSIKHIGKGED